MAEPRVAKPPAAGRTGQYPASPAERTAKQHVVQPDPWTGKQAAAAARTGQSPAVAPPRTGRQPVVAPRADYTPVPGMMAGATGTGALAFAPGATRTAVAVASRGASRDRASGSRPWIRLGDDSLNTFGKWALALACVEVLWGATVLTLGGLVITMPGQALPLPQFGLIWAGVILLLSLIGGQALSRPVYRRGAQSKLRRGFQGAGLTAYTLVVHGVAVWGATIFANTQGNTTLATVAFLLFGVNVLVVGILSVVNALS